MNKINQQMRIKNFMEQNGSITGFEATNILHIMDYRKRISEMRRKGVKIDDVWEKPIDGSPYKRYFLAEG